MRHNRIFACHPLPWTIRMDGGEDYDVFDGDGNEIGLADVFILPFAEDLVALVNRHGAVLKNDDDEEDDDRTCLRDDEFQLEETDSSLEECGDAQRDPGTQAVRGDQKGKDEGGDVGVRGRVSCGSNRAGEHGKVVGNRKEAEAQVKVTGPPAYYDSMVIALSVLFSQRLEWPFDSCVRLAHSVLYILQRVGEHYAKT